MTDGSLRQYAFLAATTRGFAILALAVASVLASDSTGVLAVLSVGCIWLTATTAERTAVPAMVTIVGEAALVGMAGGLALEETFQILTVLAFPPFTAALRRGTRGALASLVTELLGLAIVVVLVTDGLSMPAATSLVTWTIFSLGLALIGAFIHATYREPLDPLDSYRNAQALIRELIGLSDELNRGLEPVTLAATIASAVHDELPVRGVVVHVPRGEQLTPIINDHGASDEEVRAAEDLADRALRHGTILVEAHAFALPLSSGAGTVAVVTGFLSPGLDPVTLGLHQTLAELSARLEPDVVHLDTALLFAAFRDSATVEERRRLAREMHDGVAQEMASLGYLVDEIMAESDSPALALRLQVLRERLSAVVGEVRRSVRTLRTSVGENESLGTAIGSLARHLTAGSGVPIQVTLDESTQRLRPEVEAELLRIAQEAMNNAVRHSEATLIEVQCTVSPPHVEIIVSDDGRGILGRREDSHGLEIMAERARLVEADFTVRRREPHGTVISVVVDGDRTQPRQQRQSSTAAADDRPSRKSSGLGRVLQP
jgi:signal transduction histidine kinase